MPKNFDSIVKEQFQYLITEFRFRLEWCKKTDWGFDILYISNVCGVHIVYEFREAFLYITLHKLQNGKFVDNPRPIKSESIMTGYSLDDILLKKAPNTVIKPAYSYGANSQFYDKENGMALYVAKFAQNLRDYAADVLSGNFEIFKTLEPIVKKRMQSLTSN